MQCTCIFIVRYMMNLIKVVFLDEERKTQLEKLGITYVKGRKSENDKIFFYNEKPISFREVGELFAELFKNEDINYPYGKWGEYLMDFLNEVKVAGKVTEDITKKYRL